MWIPKEITGNSKQQQAMNGSVTYSDAAKTAVSTVENCNSAEKVAPYGITYVPPSGAKTLIIPVGEVQYCSGVVCEEKDILSPGELMLFSSGGANIILKNDGTVVINGQVFAAETQSQSETGE